MSDAPTNDERRSALRQWRAGLAPDEQRRRAETVADVLDTLQLWRPGTLVAMYTAVAGELDLGPTRRRAEAAGACVLLPVIDDAGSFRLSPWTDATTWSPNRFGIPEPDAAPTHRAEDVDVVVLPAVAVDPAGHRLGVGGGYYDRALAFVHDDPDSPRPRLLAAVHDEQIVERIEPSAWDVDVDVIVTPSRAIVTEVGRGPRSPGRYSG